MGSLLEMQRHISVSCILQILKVNLSSATLMNNVGMYSIAEGKQIRYEVINTIVLESKPESLCLLHIAQDC